MPHSLQGLKPFKRFRNNPDNLEESERDAPDTAANAKRNIINTLLQTQTSKPRTRLADSLLPT